MATAPPPIRRVPAAPPIDGGMIAVSIVVCSIIASIVAFFAGFALAQVLR